MVTVAVDTQAKNVVIRIRPAATTDLVPNRTASLVPTTEAIATDVATGSTRTPAASGP